MNLYSAFQDTQRRFTVVSPPPVTGKKTRDRLEIFLQRKQQQHKIKRGEKKRSKVSYQHTGTINPARPASCSGCRRSAPRAGRRSAPRAGGGRASRRRSPSSPRRRLHRCRPAAAEARRPGAACWRSCGGCSS